MFVTLEVRTGLSQPLRERFDAGQFDAVVLRREAAATDGELLGADPLGGGAPDAGPSLGLPPLPASQIVLFGRAGSPAIAQALRALAAGICASLQ